MGACCVATDVLVKPAPGMAQAISQQLMCNANGRTCGTTGPRRTPTGDALGRIGSYYQSLPPGGGEQFAIVITDSEPDCGGQDGACGEAQNATELLFSKEVKTAILGLGQDASPQFNNCLPQLADAGGRLAGGSNNGQGADYPWAADNNAVQLRQAIDQLLLPIKNRACVVKLAGSRSRESEVTVSANGVAIKFDRNHMDGWDFETQAGAGAMSRTVRIWGPKCDDIQAGRIQLQAVQASVTCRMCPDINCQMM
jgi:hypothetical protein